MKNSELWKDYGLSKVVRHNQKVNHYIGYKKLDGQHPSGEQSTEVLINEIVDREKIDATIADFLSLKTDDPHKILVDCFTDSANFYVIFRHNTMQNILKCLKKESPSFSSRIVLLKSVLTELLKYESYPNVILSSALQPENVLVEDGRVDFNIFLELYGKTPVHSAQDVYDAISVLISAVFSVKEVASQPKLSILQKKLDRALYTRIPEVIRDLDEIYRLMDTDKDLAAAAKRARAGLLRRTSKYLLILALLLSAAALVKIIYDSQKEVRVYLDTTAIGTVNLRPVLAVVPTVEADAYILVNNTVPMPSEPPEPVPTPAPTPTPAPQPSPVPEPEPDLTEIRYEYYTVVEGDTLSGISKRFYGDMFLYKVFLECNEIENEDLIYPEQIIKVPIRMDETTPINDGR